MASPARPAATVVVLRDGPDGPEVFLVQRSAKSGFMPLAHVFPGGRVDPADADVAVVGGEGDRARMGTEAATAYVVAAVRETYEESGVLLATGQPHGPTREALQKREVGFGTAAEQNGWVVDGSALVYWSWWITPEVEPRRYDTRFFLAQVDRDVSARHDDYETIDSAWWRVRDTLDAFDRGELIFAPPTWRTLWELQPYDTVAQAMAAGRLRQPIPIMPRGKLVDGCITVLLPGDPEFPAEQGVEGPTRHTLAEGRWFVHR